MASYRVKIMKQLMKSGNPKIKKPQIREAEKKSRWSIVRGDKVQVVDRNHPEFGKQGIVKKVLRDRDRVIVEGVNEGPHRIKGNAERGIKGMTVMNERSIHYSNVNLVDPVSNKPTRVLRKYLDDGTKVRVSKSSGAIIPRPDVLTIRKRPVNSIITSSDTSEADAWEETYMKPTNPLS
mmetsp:Transcript_9403/g.21646  ORF Transcript_9403/g.21646 Transcript_9403/m.21646 type:complete len:179 (-) Transcript_9403:269-805(-)|eukprot:CAMPEP_0116833270 /NCGR_PEP_ID=MMETSP0418-20121206/6345_1 /TAXON_ID=1158023 /ORGANISM="Astrosyne radiata, Strain 13vi08-1A" /LENGTH=178 /DNA_ID=CAMNT_0004462705 /DNA_START=47 /DNA_END=583 /DNA_ORIENTATION=-